MADDTSVVVEPKDTSASAPAVEPTEQGRAGEFSDELLQIPAMQALFSGSPAALSAPIEEFATRPEAKELIDHKDELQRAGMLLYRSLDGATGVIYNALKVHGEDIAAADKAGKLQEIAPPFDTVNESVGASGENNPVLNAGDPAGAATASAPESVTNPPVPSPVPPAPASTQNKITSARLKNAVMGAPTAGPSPGAGKLLKSILKPVI